MAAIKPTHKDPISDQSKEFEKDFKKTMITTAPGIRLNEVDGLLTEKEQSLKKKIWSLAKMESLVFADPKLSAVYEEMAENGEEKYGYHYNETIQNMIFNDYVLNSPHYLQKYKMAIPKEKKRRDKSGINQLKKAGIEKMDATGTKLKKPAEVDESTSAGSAGGAAGYVGYAGPSAWSTKGDLSGDFKGKKKETDPKAKPISTGFALHETNYLIDPQGFEKYVEMLNEESDADYVLNHSQAYGSVDNMNPENQKIIRKDIESGKWDSNNNIKNGIALQEKAKSKSQQQLMGMAYAYKKGEFDGEPSDEIKKIANGMSEKDLEDFASTKHKGLPDHVDEHHLDSSHNDEITGAFTLDNKGKIIDFIVLAKLALKPELENSPINFRVHIESYFAHNDKGLRDYYLRTEEELRNAGIDPETIEAEADEINQGNIDEELGVNKFIVTVKHDNGTTRIMTSASSEEAAREKIMNAENCPASAILKVEKENNIKEETQTMIQNNGTSMSNQADPIGDQGSEVPMGAQDTGGLNEAMKKMSEALDEISTGLAKKAAGQALQGVEYSDPNNNRTQQERKFGDYLNPEIERLVNKQLSKWGVQVWAAGDTVNLKIPVQNDNVPAYISIWKDKYFISPADLERIDSYLQSLLGDVIKRIQQDMAKAPETNQQVTNSIGTGSTGLNEDMALLEEINNELTAFAVHHKKLKLMSEEKKTPSQILNKRVNDENPKNFKKDLQHSGTKEIIDVEKQLQWKDQQTDVPADPQKLGMDIEKQEIKTADMEGDEALKNVGDSTNRDGDEIPKRNLTTKEQEEVNLYRNGQHSLNYDNEPSERFVDRMEADQGEFFEMGEKQKKFKAGAPLYDKDPQPIDDTEVEKVQWDKNVKRKGDEVAWNERMGLGSNIKLSESMITGRYHDGLNKRRLLEFNLSEVKELKTPSGTARQTGLFEMDFTGLGNKYLNKSIDKKVLVNEAVVKAIDTHKFYTNGKNVFAMKNPVQTLTEGKVKQKPVITEQEKKMKHLLGYKPQDFVNTKNIRL